MKLNIVSETIRSSIKQYRLKSIFMRNLLIYITSITLPIIVLNILVLSLYTNQLDSKQETESSVSLVRLVDTTVSAFDEAANISYILSTDYYVQQFMDKNILSAGEISKQSRCISKSIASFINSNTYIDSIFVYSEKQNLVYGNHSSNYLENYYDNSWYEDYMKYKDVNSAWINYRKIKSSDNYLSKDLSVITHFFVVQTELLNYGLIGININPKAFPKNMYSNIGDVIIFNNEKLPFFNTSSLSNKQINEISRIIPDISCSGTTKKISMFNKNFLVYRDPDYNLFFLLSVPDVLEVQKDMLAVSFLTIFASLIIVVVLSITAGRKSLQPLEEIMTFVKKQTAYNHNSLSPSSSEIDYIMNTLINSFNLNQDLKTELSTNLLTLEQYQIMALQTQINPHFLYNTLNAINMSVMELTDGKNNASIMIEELSALLRFVLSTGSYLINLEDEIDCLQKYISIQKKRWPDKFDVVFNIPDNLKNHHIIKFSLQPIVENSINHGIKKLRHKGLIIISAAEEKDTLKITVHDNGVGIPSEKLKNLDTLLSKNDLPPLTSHIGLSNVNKRIKLMFGHKYGLNIDSEENLFTSVHYTMPSISEKDFHKDTEKI